MFLNNPGVSEALAHMAEIFRDEVAVAYGEDWWPCTIHENYLPGHIISPPSSPIKWAGPSQHHPASFANTVKTRMEHPPLPALSGVSTTTSLTEWAAASHTQDSPPPTPKVKVRRAHTSTHSPSQAAPPSTVHDTKPTAWHTTPLDAGLSSLLPALLALSSTVTLSSPVASGIISRVAGSYLPNVVEEFMKDIGKGSAGECEIICDIYLFTGRALWESSFIGRIRLSSGSAKALVGLLLNIA